MDLAENINVDVMTDISSDSNQYLTFMLNGEEYGVDILRVQEIKGWDNVTPIPSTPEYIKGVINLRGTIVPIIDLRLKFELETIPYGATTVVIVLKVMNNDKERTMGIVVDAVSDVYNVAKEDMQPPPDFGNIDVSYVNGLATVNETMIIALNIDTLLNSDAVPAVEAQQ